VAFATTAPPKPDVRYSYNAVVHLHRRGAFCGWDSELCLTLRGATVRPIRALYSGEDVILEMTPGKGCVRPCPLVDKVPLWLQVHIALPLLALTW
jgi:hypothetical protein